MDGGKNRIAKFARDAGYLYHAYRAAKPVVRGALEAVRSWTRGESRSAGHSARASKRDDSRALVRRAEAKVSRRSKTSAPRKLARSRQTRTQTGRVRKTFAKSRTSARKRIERAMFDVLSPRNEYITQSSGQIRTAGVGITGQGNQQITILNTPFSYTDIEAIRVNALTAVQVGEYSSGGSTGSIGGEYGKIKLDYVHGYRSHHMYEFVNSGNQDVHFTVWWFKCKQDFTENTAAGGVDWTTMAEFLDVATASGVASLNRGAPAMLGTYTNVTNPYHIVGWNPNQVPNNLIKKYFKVKVGPTTIIRPGGHKKLRVPLGKGARTWNFAERVVTQMTAAQGKGIYRKGDIIPIIATYGDVVHGSVASGNTTAVSTGSVTLDYVRIGHHHWQVLPSVVPVHYFGGAGLNQTTALGGGVTLADAAGTPAIYSADA